LPVDQRMAPTTGIAREQAGLAVLDPSCRTGLLPCNTGGLCALLQKPVRRANDPLDQSLIQLIIYNQNSIRIANLVKGIAPNARA
jgi:hypothetical protein